MSIFTEIHPANWVAHNSLAFAIRDGFPVAPGHTLVIPNREILDWFEASDAERVAIFELVDLVKESLEREFSPAGYNIGMNCGEAAGQTVMHLHVHVIPRFVGDMPDPRGGVRHVIPWKGNYKLHRAAPLATGGDDPFLKHLSPLFARASQIDILAAFVQDSGIALIESQLISAVERNAQVRILCSDYLHIMQEAAVRRLHDLQSAYAGQIKTKIARSWKTSFHPKSWQFITPEGGSIFVGSSNLSHAALNEGIEWNLRLDRHLDPAAFQVARDAFEATWNEAEALTHEFVQGYRQRVLGKLNDRPVDLPLGDAEEEVLQSAPSPHSIQLRVLAGLQQARDEGHRRALAVMATGLGKTWLAAFDVRQFCGEGVPRVLYVAHRAEILNQAANTFRVLFPTARTAWFVGDQSDLDGDFVFASIQKIARPESLARILAQNFDYVIIDEVHHAAADSYLGLLQELDPGFLLGLTATPDRADGQDILSLFNDYLVDDVGIVEGIEVGRLVPFKYRGIADTIDFAPIPWRAGKFDSTTLANAAQTQARMDQLWQVISEQPTMRTLAFCCTIEHALFVRDWLANKGLRVAAVVSSPAGDDRAASLQALADGDLDVVCAVDILNEGVDIPGVDRVLFLRPTESKIVFLQQLGRGLRVAPDKEHLEVIDFVGNHSIFEERMRWMLSIGAPAEFRKLLDNGRMDLPAGCSIELSFEAKELLKKLAQGRDKNPVVAAYRQHKNSKGVRPRAAELFHEGHNLSKLRGTGGWMALVHAEGDSKLSQPVFDLCQDWFKELETTSMTKCFKIVLMQALVEENALFSGLPFDQLAERSLRIIRRSPELLGDLDGVAMIGPTHEINDQKWLSYWKKNPIAAWSNSAFVKIDGDYFRLRWPSEIESDSVQIQTLVRELLDYRLSQYKARIRNVFYAHVTHNDRKPILMIPRKEGTPDGEVLVRLEDGVEWVFRFAKIAINVAHPVGTTKNRLPELLHAWFGKNAGANQTSQRVRFETAGGKLFARPMGSAQVIDLENDLDDELLTYLSALEGSYDFHRRIIYAMRSIGNASDVEIQEYLASFSAVESHGPTPHNA